MTSSIFHIIGAHQMLGIIVEVFRPSAEMRLLLGKGKDQLCTARGETPLHLLLSGSSQGLGLSGTLQGAQGRAHSRLHTLPLTP